MNGFVVITQHVVGNESNGFEVEFRSDRKLHVSRAAALKAGYRQCDSDDFNIGTVRDRRLVAFGWGDQDVSEDGTPNLGHDLAEIEAGIGGRW